MKAVRNAKKITKTELIDSIWKNHGMATVICAELDITWIQLHRLFDRWPDVKQQFDNAKKDLIELANQVLLDSLESKSESIKLKAAETIIKYGQNQKYQELSIQPDGKIDIRTIFGIE